MPCSTQRTSTAAGKFVAVLLLSAGLIATAPAAEEVKITNLLTQALSGIPGKEVTMITVNYPPGGSNPVHRHHASVFVYVLEGSIVMQVEGGKQMTLQPGETFYEDPQDVHLVSRNASNTAAAKFLVFFVKDQGAPLLMPASK